MSHYQNQYSAQSGTDQYGYPIRQADEYGNVISETGHHADQLRRTDEYGNVISETGHLTADPLRRTDEFRDQYGNQIRRTEEYGVGDDPTGRASGMYEGGGGYGSVGQQQQHKGGIFHHDKPHNQSTSTMGSGGYTAADQGGVHEKKGLMEKIKENLPGGRHH